MLDCFVLRNWRCPCPQYCTTRWSCGRWSYSACSPGSCTNALFRTTRTLTFLSTFTPSTTRFLSPSTTTPLPGFNYVQFSIVQPNDNILIVGVLTRSLMELNCDVLTTLALKKRVLVNIVGSQLQISVQRFKKCNTVFELRYKYILSVLRENNNFLLPKRRGITGYARIT